MKGFMAKSVFAVLVVLVVIGVPQAGQSQIAASAILQDGTPTPTPAPGEAIGYIMVDGIGGIHTTSRAGGPLVGPYVANEIKDLTAYDNINGALPDLLFDSDIVRGLAITPNQDGFWVLDGLGLLHPYGNAVAPLALDEGGSQYFRPGWDIARDVEAGPDNAGAFILDGWGAVHAAGSARGASFMSEPRPYFGWDIARDIEMTPDLGGYALLDGLGAVHYVGNAEALYAPAGGGIYFGWDAAKDLELPIDGGKGYYILDRLGGVFALGDTRQLPTAYFGWDVAEDLEELFFPDLVDQPDHRGIALWQLDAFGGIHPAMATRKVHDITNNMVRFSLIHYIGYDIARDFEVITRAGVPDFSTFTPTPTFAETPFTPTFTPTMTPFLTITPEATLTPTWTETSFVPTATWTPEPLPTITMTPGASGEVATCSFFPLESGNTWYYIDQPSQAPDTDAFTWTVEESTETVPDGEAARIRTDTDESTDDRNGDVDFWLCNESSELRFAGFYKAPGTDIPEGNYILNSALLVGTGSQSVPATVTDSSVYSPGFPLPDVAIDSVAEYVEILPSLETPLGTFTDVLVLNLTVNVSIPFVGDYALLDNTFYLKEGVGMVAQKQRTDPNDALHQEIQSGTVGGSAVVAAK